MSRKRIERRLADVGDRLRLLREEARVCAAQLAQVADEADDARLRALVSESPMDRHVDRDARRSADTLRRRQHEVEAEIVRLETRQDDLLDELVSLNDPE